MEKKDINYCIENKINIYCETIDESRDIVELLKREGKAFRFDTIIQEDSFYFCNKYIHCDRTCNGERIAADEVLEHHINDRRVVRTIGVDKYVFLRMNWLKFLEDVEDDERSNYEVYNETLKKTFRIKKTKLCINITLMRK